MCGAKGGGVLRNPIAWGVLEPPPFLKRSPGGGFFFLTQAHPFIEIFFRDMLFGCTSKVLSLPPIQPLLILSSSPGTPENTRVT